MRILYLLTSLGIGGAEKQVIDLAERMAAKGHKVAFIVLKHTSEEWPVKLPVLRLNMAKTPRGVLRGINFAKNFLGAFQPDIIHSHTFPANIFARLLRVLSGTSVPRSRLINTIHNVHEGGLHRMLLYFLTDPLVDEVTAVSAAAAERFTRLHAVSASKMRVLTNGIDTEMFAPDRSRRKRLRMRMKVGDAFVWLAVGRLVPAKDYPNLVRAFQQVRVAQPTACLWIAGEGGASAVEAILDVVQRTEGIEFLGLRRDVVDLLDAADGYVLSSAWEGMPLALAEAMAMEKQVVATDVGGVRELVGSAGMIVKAKDSKALGEAMIDAMTTNEWQRKSKGRDARRRIEVGFSMQAKVIEWEQLYAESMEAGIE